MTIIEQKMQEQGLTDELLTKKFYESMGINLDAKELVGWSKWVTKQLVHIYDGKMLVDKIHAETKDMDHWQIRAKFLEVLGCSEVEKEQDKAIIKKALEFINGNTQYETTDSKRRKVTRPTNDEVNAYLDQLYADRESVVAQLKAEEEAKKLAKASAPKTPRKRSSKKVSDLGSIDIDAKSAAASMADMLKDVEASGVDVTEV